MSMYIVSIRPGLFRLIMFPFLSSATLLLTKNCGTILRNKTKRYCVIELHYLARASAALKVCGYCIVASNSLNSNLLFPIGKYMLLDNKILGRPIILYITMSVDEIFYGKNCHQRN